MDKLVYERKWQDNGLTFIAGVDEVGRGPLAGPVVCAAVIMPLNDLIDGIDDSKKLSEKKRQILSEVIKEKAIDYSIFEISPEEIDQINILNAVKKCMISAVKSLKIEPQITLVDGVDTALDINAEYIIKGDSKSYSIGCASILAKVYRDNLMVEKSKEFPEYFFEKHSK